MNDGRGTKRTGRDGFALQTALLLVTVLTPIALAAFTLVSIADRRSERSLDRFDSFYIADGALRVAAVRIGQTPEDERPAAPVVIEVESRETIVSPASVDTWNFATTIGEGRSTATVEATLRWSGGEWELLRYEVCSEEG